LLLLYGMQATPSSADRPKKACVIGPECTGKTELSEFLAGHFQTVWVQEYARAYLNRLGRPYEEHDLLKIAHGQWRMEQEWLHDASRVLICDTNITVIKIWSEFKYGHCAREILDMVARQQYDLYLLTYVDLPWQDDPQREHPTQREVLWNIYRAELSRGTTPVVEIRGERKERQQTAVKAITSIL